MKNKRKGEMTINGTIALLGTMALLVLSITVFGVINQINILNTMAQEMTRYIETRGCYDAAASDEFERLCTAGHMHASIDVKGHAGSGKIQLGEPIKVLLKAQTNIGVGGLFKIPITISASATGRGEKLWKQ